MEEKRGRRAGNGSELTLSANSALGTVAPGCGVSSSIPWELQSWMEVCTPSPATSASTLRSQSKPKRVVWRGGMAHPALGSAFTLSTLAGLNGSR